jgi:hypothetical protein
MSLRSKNGAAEAGHVLWLRVGPRDPLIRHELATFWGKWDSTNRTCFLFPLDHSLVAAASTHHSGETLATIPALLAAGRDASLGSGDSLLANVFCRSSISFIRLLFWKPCALASSLTGNRRVEVHDKNCPERGSSYLALRRRQAICKP